MTFRKLHLKVEGEAGKRGEGEEGSERRRGGGEGRKEGRGESRGEEEERRRRERAAEEEFKMDPQLCVLMKKVDNYSCTGDSEPLASSSSAYRLSRVLLELEQPLQDEVDVQRSHGGHGAGRTIGLLVAGRQQRSRVRLRFRHFLVYPFP